MRMALVTPLVPRYGTVRIDPVQERVFELQGRPKRASSRVVRRYVRPRDRQKSGCCRGVLAHHGQGDVDDHVLLPAHKTAAPAFHEDVSYVYPVLTGCVLGVAQE